VFRCERYASANHSHCRGDQQNVLTTRASPFRGRRSHKGHGWRLGKIAGILLLFVSPKALNILVIFFTAHELSEDPDDWFATTLRHAVNNLSSDTKLFVSAYLDVHGLVKVFLTAGLLREKLWAYPTALWFLGIFLLYQLYRFSHTHSLGLLALSAFDLFVASLVWLEYRSRKQHECNAR
jgi:uncharacterized membrane protein